MSVLDYARSRLFEPLGIDTRPAFEEMLDAGNLDAFVAAGFAWPVDGSGLHLGWTGLKLRPADLVRIGQMMLDSGRWKGKQVVPADWVRESTTQQADTVSNRNQDNAVGQVRLPVVGHGGRRGTGVLRLGRWRAAARGGSQPVPGGRGRQRDRVRPTPERGVLSQRPHVPGRPRDRPVRGALTFSRSERSGAAPLTPAHPAGTSGVRGRRPTRPPRAATRGSTEAAGPGWPPVPRGCRSAATRVANATSSPAVTSGDSISKTARCCHAKNGRQVAG